MQFTGYSKKKKRLQPRWQPRLQPSLQPTPDSRRRTVDAICSLLASNCVRLAAALRDFTLATRERCSTQIWWEDQRKTKNRYYSNISRPMNAAGWLHEVSSNNFTNTWAVLIAPDDPWRGGGHLGIPTNHFSQNSEKIKYFNFVQILNSEDFEKIWDKNIPRNFGKIH